jgi:hypothetical protein
MGGRSRVGCCRRVRALRLNAPSPRARHRNPVTSLSPSPHRRAAVAAQNGVHLLRAGRKGLRMRSEGAPPLEALLQSIDAWLVIDVGASLSLLTTAILWARVVASLSTLQATVGGRTFAGPSLETDTTLTQAYLGAALASYAAFKSAATATLVFLTLRLFWQFSLQPRLAVMTECLSRAASDLGHFGFLFLVSYAVWGHVAFGPQMAGWRTLADSSFAIVRFSMYDYDLTVRRRTR